MKPVIGITACHEEERFYKTNDGYVHAVLRAGGIPLLIPAALPPEEAAALAGELDGILIPGGIDAAPQCYGEEPLARVTQMDRAMDGMELALIRRAAELGKPLLAICRGCQMLNIALGGTLWQDIPSQCPGALGHYQETADRSQPYHTVEILPGSRLAAVLGEGKVLTNSYHHQAVRELGKGLRVSARACDGIIEAVEGESLPILGVQWHPECMEERHPLFRRLFAWLTGLAGGGPDTAP